MSARSPATLDADDGHELIAARAIARTRNKPTSGISRRALLRRSIGAGLGVLGIEAVAVVIGGGWPLSFTASKRVRVGTLADLVATNPGLPVADGFPAYVADARAFVLTLDPARGWMPGIDPTGDGTSLNVRVLSQVCPHLGCRPNPCVEDFWFHCPCHQSRYDGHGIKAAGLGPADRGMDRMAIEVDRDGVLTVLPNQITQGPQPVPLGQIGLIPPRVARGCGG